MPLRILILQHPQEKKIPFRSVPLIQEQFPDALVQSGLSWKNLDHALKGTDLASQKQTPQNWCVLYLGTQKHSQLLGDRPTPGLYGLGESKVTPWHLPHPRPNLEGIVILDGTWSQSKTLWWRNPWLLKLKRVLLIPPTKSFYKNIRKEPRKECVSSYEALTYALDFLEGNPSATTQRIEAFKNYVRPPKKPAKETVDPAL